MLTIERMILKGDDPMRTIELRRTQTGVDVFSPFVPKPVASFTADDLPGSILDRILPLLYGEPNNLGRYTATDADMRKTVFYVEFFLS